MKLYERLRELRHERQLKLKAVAQASGISVPYLSDIERGRTNPSLDTLQAIAQAYSITVHDLLYGVEFTEDSTVVSLPQGLGELVTDPQLGQQLTPDWVKTLAKIELRGQRPQTKMDWYEIFLHLRRILD